MFKYFFYVKISIVSFINNYCWCFACATNSRIMLWNKNSFIKNFLISYFKFHYVCPSSINNYFSQGKGCFKFFTGRSIVKKEIFNLGWSD